MSDAEAGLAPSPREAFKLGTPVNELYRDPAGYDPGEDLEAAVSIALLLRLPLLLTGEPGCGKTSVAYWLAWKLKLAGPEHQDEPLVYNVKSITTGRDLLYEFDELDRFRDSQPGGQRKPLESYLRLNALGRAILFSSPPDRSVGLGPLTYVDLAGTTSQGGAADTRFGRPHVVLIDELDKAPRDTPNDLLLEIDEMRFRIRELDAWVEGSPEHRPLLIITSNSEKSLPEPFLRRCVFHHIRSPDEARRREIVSRRRHPFAQRAQLFDAAMTFFDLLHGSPDRPSDLSRPPGTAELLAWLTVLEETVSRIQAASPLHISPGGLNGMVRHTLGIVAKTREDLERAEGVMLREGLG
jgi:MoxR-like ATPase